MADLQRWAEMPDQDQTFPILSDGGWEVSSSIELDGYIPSVTLIGRDMKLLIVDGMPSGAQIDQALDEPIPEVEWARPPDLDEVPEDADSDAAYHESSPFGGGDMSRDDGGYVSPWGGAGCSASLAPGACGWLAVLAFGVAGARRRR